MPKPLKATSALGLGFAAALLLSAPAGLLADEGQKDQPPSLSDTVAESLDKLKPLIDAKDWTGSVKFIDDLMEKVTPESYDQVFLDETKAKLLTQEGKYADAIQPLEASVDIADRHHFHTSKQDMDSLYLLSQLYYEESEIASKTDHDLQVSALAKAAETIKRWMSIAPKLTVEVSEYYSQLLYSEAVAKDGNHPDPELIKESRDQTEKTLLLSAHPKDTVYVFLLAALQQEQDYAQSTKILELLLTKNPAKADYWRDLVNLYIVLGQSEKDTEKAKKYNIRAINTLERAQALGYLKTPKDNYNLFTFYYECGQYGTAADLLYAGLKDDTIDSTLDKWELLASSYQQIDKDFTAIDVLDQASKRYPTKGDLDLKIAAIYAQQDNGEKAFEHYELAAQKGGMSKSQETYMYLAIAYQGYELGKYDEALTAINKDIELQQGPPDHQQEVLKKAIEDTIKERDAKKAEDAAAAAAAKT